MSPIQAPPGLIYPDCVSGCQYHATGGPDGACQAKCRWQVWAEERNVAKEYPKDREVINPANGPTTWGQLFGRDTPAVPAPVPVCPPVPSPQPVGCTLTVPVIVVASKKKGINARDKGQRGEREVIDLLQVIVDMTRKKHLLPALVLQRNTLQAHLGGCDLHGLTGFSVEVKFQEAEYSNLWWLQCLKQAKDGQVPILFYRRSRVPWTVKMRIYAQTPLQRDQIQMDVTIGFGDFMQWFQDAYDEACAAEALALAS